MYKLRLIIGLLILAVVYIVSCENNNNTDKTLNEEDINKFKKEVEEEIMARKIDVMQMKKDITELQDTVKSKLLVNINKSEEELIKFGNDFDKLKRMNDSVFTSRKSVIDSSLRYLGGYIDSTKLNILVEREEQH